MTKKTKKSIDPEIVSLAAHSLNCEFSRLFRELVEKITVAARCFDEDTKQEVNDRMCDDANVASVGFIPFTVRKAKDPLQITGESGNKYQTILDAVSAEPPEPIFINGIKYFTLKDGELYWAK